MLLQICRRFALHFIISAAGLVRAELTPYSGSWGVGTVDIEVPVEPRNISSTPFLASGQPAFQLESILFSLYYPARKGDNSTKPPHKWIPQPLDLVAKGFSAYANRTGSLQNFELIRFGLETLVGGVTIPAAVDVPLLEQNDPFPIVVFSHGDSSLPSWYSQYLGELASRGYVVAAVAHRDGSSPATIITRQDGSSRNVTYTIYDQITPPLNDTEFRQQQRNFRQVEIEQVVNVLRNISTGGGDGVFKQNFRKEGEQLNKWNGKLNFDQIIISGHSFGATTALQTLAGGSNSSVRALSAIVLDPGKNSGLLNNDIVIPILIADSTEWSSIPSAFGTSNHFTVVKDIAQGSLNRTSGGWFMTLLGAAHTSITDAPLVGGSLLGSFGGDFNATILPADGVAQYVKVSSEFLDFVRNGSRTGVLAAGVTHPQYNVINETGYQATPEDVKRFWQIHVAPPALNANDTGKPSLAPRTSAQYGLMLLGILIGLVNL